MLKEANLFLTIVGALTMKDMFDEYLSQRRKHGTGTDDSAIQQVYKDFQNFVHDRTRAVADKLQLVGEGEFTNLRDRVERLEQQMVEMQAPSGAQGEQQGQ